jgi:CxxC motif-containing protein (DUF1111 family)
LPGALLVFGCAEDADDDAQTANQSERLPGGATTNTLLLGSAAFTMPAANVTPEHEAAFYSGNSFFNQAWVQAPASTDTRDGLGPLFNARSCATCHFKDGRGRGPLEPDEAFSGLLLRLSVPAADGTSIPEPTYGGQLQPSAILGVPAEGTPRVEYRTIAGEFADGTPYELLQPTYTVTELSYGPLHADVQISPRVAPAMIGLGLLEAIPSARLQALADPDDTDADGISGRINHVPDVTTGESSVGRFGWKAEQPSVRQQAAAAFLGDIGITSSLFTAQDCTASEAECAATVSGGAPEIADHLLDRVELYSKLLAVPARERWQDRKVLDGKRLFTAAGCAKCHVPSHETDPAASYPELAHQTIWPYSDLLLHDMGESLSDHRPSFEADGREWRTPPLWGLRLYRVVNGHERLLHDGRARGVVEATLWHAGEAEASREAFRGMSANEREALVMFVESL